VSALYSETNEFHKCLSIFGRGVDISAMFQPKAAEAQRTVRLLLVVSPVARTQSTTTRSTIRKLPMSA
jgi:hypothetical protein